MLHQWLSERTGRGLALAIACLTSATCWTCDDKDDAPARADSAIADSGTGNDGGAPVACKKDSDCGLVDTCCDCMPETADTPPACEQSCEVSLCESLGIEATWLTCGHHSGGNRCEPKKTVSCSPYYTEFADDAGQSGTISALCTDPAPECGDRLVAEYNPADDCWSGRCVPVSFCDRVVNCTDCPSDQACVAQIISGTNRVELSCTRPVSACNGVVGCDCAGDELCGGAAVCLDDFPDSDNVAVLRRVAKGGLICAEDDG